MTSTLNLALPCPKCGAKAATKCRSLLDGSEVKRSHVSRTPEQPCGSFGAYQRHIRRGETPCDPCNEAHNRYMQEYRSRNPEKRQKDISDLRARREATKALIARHRAEFADLLNQAKRGAA